jgi:hypothetical protein
LSYSYATTHVHHNSKHPGAMPIPMPVKKTPGVTTQVQVPNPLGGVGGALDGAYKWMQGNSILMIIGGAIGFYLFRGEHNNLIGIFGQLFFLGLLVIGGIFFLTNFAGITNILPNVTAGIRKAINPGSS